MLLVPIWIASTCQCNSNEYPQHIYSAEDIAIGGNGTGLEYMCSTRHFVYIFFNPVFQLSTAKNEINVLILAPVTFAQQMQRGLLRNSCLYFTNYWMQNCWIMENNNITLGLASFTNVLTLVLLNPDIPCLYKQCRSNWSGSALFVIRYVNLFQQIGSSNLIGWKLEVGVASNLFSMTRVNYIHVFAVYMAW